MAAVDFSVFLQRVPAVTYYPAYDPHSDPEGSENAWAGIQALTYEGAPRGGQMTRVFAYIGFPAGSSAEKPVPAVVLVHGGGGHAFAEWIKIWNDRGYAAIAMDTTGHFPSEMGRGCAGRESDIFTDWWRHGLYGPFAQMGYADGPDNDEMSGFALPVEEQWMYYAIVATMGARNILTADSRVDAAKIGITGISWGGVIASLAIGYDPGYAFAIPIYGSAYLDESLGWMGPLFSRPETRTLWSAADRLCRVKYPVLWMCWAEDTPFSVNSVSRSYMDTKAVGARFVAKLAMGHSHACGWTQEESYRFADAAVGKRPALTAIVQEPTAVPGMDGTYTVTSVVTPAVDAVTVTAAAAYITAPISYSHESEKGTAIEQIWQTAPLCVEGNTVTGTLPADAKDFYVIVTTVTADGVYEVSSGFVQGLGT